MALFPEANEVINVPLFYLNYIDARTGVPVTKPDPSGGGGEPDPGGGGEPVPDPPDTRAITVEPNTKEVFPTTPPTKTADTPSLLMSFNLMFSTPGDRAGTLQRHEALGNGVVKEFNFSEAVAGHPPYAAAGTAPTHAAADETPINTKGLGKIFTIEHPSAIYPTGNPIPSTLYPEGLLGDGTRRPNYYIRFWAEGAGAFFPNNWGPTPAVPGGPADSFRRTWWAHPVVSVDSIDEQIVIGWTEHATWQKSGSVDWGHEYRFLIIRIPIPSSGRFDPHRVGLEKDRDNDYTGDRQKGNIPIEMPIMSDARWYSISSRDLPGYAEPPNTSGDHINLNNWHLAASNGRVYLMQAEPKAGVSRNIHSFTFSGGANNSEGRMVRSTSFQWNPAEAGKPTHRPEFIRHWDIDAGIEMYSIDGINVFTRTFNTIKTNLHKFVVPATHRPASEQGEHFGDFGEFAQISLDTTQTYRGQIPANVRLCMWNHLDAILVDTLGNTELTYTKLKNWRDTTDYTQDILGTSEFLGLNSQYQNTRPGVQPYPGTPANAERDDYLDLQEPVDPRYAITVPLDLLGVFSPDIGSPPGQQQAPPPRKIKRPEMGGEMEPEETPPPPETEMRNGLPVEPHEEPAKPGNPEGLLPEQQGQDDQRPIFKEQLFRAAVHLQRIGVVFDADVVTSKFLSAGGRNIEFRSTNIMTFITKSLPEGVLLRPATVYFDLNNIRYTLDKIIQNENDEYLMDFRYRDLAEEQIRRASRG